MLKTYFDRDNKLKFSLSRIAAAALVSLLYLLAVYFTCGMWFETNDDVFITEMLSGKLTGVPEYHCAFVNALITFPLSKLYSVSTGIPWWGLSVFLMLFFGIFICFIAVLYRSDKLSDMIVGCILIAATITACIHNFGQPQYTSAAMILAVAGYLAVFGFKKSKTSLILFAICELIACSFRDSAMMIIQPMGFCFIVGFFVYEYKTEKKGTVKQLVAFLSACFAIAILSVALTKIVSIASFSGSDWKNFDKYYSAHTYLFDYQKPISYNDISGVLSKYDIDQNEYEQFLEYRFWYPENKISDSLVNELLPVLKNIRKTDTDNRFFSVGALQLLFTSSQFWNIHRFAAFLFILSIVLIILKKEWKFLYPAVLTFCGYLLGLLLLAYRNKYALRVMLPYYLGACLFFALTIWAVNCCKKDVGKNKTLVTLLSIAISAAVVLPALFIGKTQFAYIRRQNNLVNTNEYTAMKEITNYCNSHPENRYIADMSYERMISTDIFCTDYYRSANFIYSGSWYSSSPSMVKRAVDYISDNDLYYLVYEAQEIKGMDGAEFYASKIMSLPEETDTFKLSNGATIHVYRLEKDSAFTSVH